MRVDGGGDPRLSARPRTPTESAPPAGPNPLGLGGGRDGILYVPSGYDPSSPPPLFVAMHGTPGSSALWAPFYDACDDRGMVMLALDSRNLGWDLIDQGSFGIDVPFIDEALDYTFERIAVDPDRVALLGFSDGASYTLSLGLSNGDLFTHLVAFSPGFVDPTAPIVGRPRIFVSHGTSDPVLPIAASRLEIVPLLTRLGYDVTYEEFDGAHEVPREIANMGFDFFTA